ncbi:MAG: EAL domain-containing response regulator [Polyangiaceae bacterium]
MSDHSAESTAENKATVLLVEDNEELRAGFERLMARLGYAVDTAPNGVAALDRIAHREYDAILSDIAMPEMDGIQLLRKLRERNGIIPFIVLTGEPTVTTAAQALELGAFRYLTKPLSYADLKDTLHKAICYHRVARAKASAAELLGNGMGPGDRATLEATFARALGSLWVAFQPIVSLKKKVVLGYEALLRSREPALPHPGAMLEAAERLGQLDLLGRTIRRRAATDMVSAHPSALLFVNLHVRDLADPTLLDPDEPLSKIASRVVLEITERAALDEVGDVRVRVATLRQMGFRVAIDDLGAGYSGLASFAQLEPEVVKLDMSLVRDVHQSATKQKIVRSMARLTDEMDLMVVAEGVETRAELDMLSSLGCDIFQGYYFAKPGPPLPSVNWG